MPASFSLRKRHDVQITVHKDNPHTSNRFSCVRVRASNVRVFQEQTCAMHEQVMSCFGSCVGAPAGSQYYESAEQAKTARFRDKQLTKLLNKYHKEDLKRLKLLLLGEFTLPLKSL